jgi:hypothetical protein
VESTDAVVVGCLLLVFAWAGILMWRSVKPPRYLWLSALLPALFASALVALQMAVDAGETVAIVTIYACAVAMIVPFAIMMRHQIVRLVQAVIPSARLVRRRRRS